MTYTRPLGGLGHLLMVIPWLIKEQEVLIEDLERRFAIKPGQLVEDMEALNEVDLFVSPEQRFSVEITEDRVKVLEAPNFPATPGLLPYEALVCLVAAKTVLEMNPGSPDLSSAVQKLEKAIMSHETHALRVLSASDPPWVKQLREWTIAGQVVWMRYRSTDKGELSDRVVEPWQVYQWKGIWYLWGHSRTKGEPRRYRVDGVQRAKPTGETFVRPRRVPLPPTDYRPAPDDHRMVLEIQPRGHWVIEYYSMRILCEDPSGLVLAEFYTRDPRIAAQLALRLGPDLRIVEGDAARKELAELAAHVLERYANPSR